MVTPPKNDVASVPLNAEGRKVAAAWDLDQDNASGTSAARSAPAGSCACRCASQIAWQDDMTLKLETDAGKQTRLFRFASRLAARSRQLTTAPASARGRASSTAEWVKQAQSRGLGFGGRGGAGASGGSSRS